MRNALNTVFRYLSQDSTWRGIIGLAAAAGVAITPELAAAILAAGMGAVGLINVLRDGGKL